MVADDTNGNQVLATELTEFELMLAMESGTAYPLEVQTLMKNETTIIWHHCFCHKQLMYKLIPWQTPNLT